MRKNNIFSLLFTKKLIFILPAFLILSIGFAAILKKNNATTRELLNDLVEDHLSEFTTYTEDPSDGRWTRQKLISLEINEKNTITAVTFSISNMGSDFPIYAQVEELTFNVKDIVNISTVELPGLSVMSDSTYVKKGKLVLIVPDNEALVQRKFLNFSKNGAGIFEINQDEIKEKPKDTIEDITKFCLKAFKQGKVIAREEYNAIKVPAGDQTIAKQINDLLIKIAGETGVKFKKTVIKTLSE